MNGKARYSKYPHWAGLKKSLVDAQTIEEAIAAVAGAGAFVDLSDTPADYTGKAMRSPVVNLAENALLLRYPATLQDSDGDTGLYVERFADEDRIRGRVAGVECLLFSPDGIQTLAKQARAKVYRATLDQVIPSATITPIDHNTEVYDVQNEFSLATDRYTAKEAGLYLVIAGGTILAVNDGVQVNVYIYKNGVLEDAAMMQASSAAANPKVSVLSKVELAIGDFLDSRVWHNHGANRNLKFGIIQTNLMITKVG